MLVPSIGKFVNITYIDADFNHMSGTIPEEVGAWTQLTSFAVVGNDFSGTIPQEVGAWTHLTALYATSNHFSGPLPQEMSTWTQLTIFRVDENHFSSAPLPMLPFATLSDCKLLHGGSNSFTCPWPAGATAHCKKFVNPKWINITDDDCTPYNKCTGSSMKLEPAQCLGWIDFHDSTGGSGWTNCSGMRTDPCACMGRGASWSPPVCSPDGTVVYQM